eukprot:1027936-Rhodomonas_salina.1
MKRGFRQTPIFRGSTAVTALAELLDEVDPSVRAAAATAIGHVASRPTITGAYPEANDIGGMETLCPRSEVPAGRAGTRPRTREGQTGRIQGPTADSCTTSLITFPR